MRARVLQRLSGELTVTNSDTAVAELTLRAVTSDHRWQVALQNSTASVSAGQRLVVPVEVQVPADAWADQPVRVSVLARDAQGRQVETWSEVAVERNAVPVAPVQHWPVPSALRGAFNAAWTPFGATWTEGTPKEIRDAELRDNLVFPGKSASCCRRSADWKDAARPLWTLKLPGSEPLSVAGVAIEHFGSNAINSKIRRATLLLSNDGENFTEALRFETLPVLTQQTFALAAPVAARYARLRIEDTFGQPNKQVTAGEWKVLLQPGQDLSGGAGYNVAAPEFGGHVAWTWPPDSSIASVLTNDDKPTWAVLDKSPSVDYVIGFHRNRAAQISRVEWQYHESSPPESRSRPPSLPVAAAPSASADLRALPPPASTTGTRPSS